MDTEQYGLLEKLELHASYLQETQNLLGDY